MVLMVAEDKCRCTETNNGGNISSYWTKNRPTNWIGSSQHMQKSL